MRAGDESRERGKHRGQARTQAEASDENLRDRVTGKKGYLVEEANNRSVPHPGKRVWELGGTSNQGVLNHRRDQQDL